MYHQTIRTLAALALSLAVTAGVALAASQPVELEGIIARTQIGGIEMPRVTAYRIGLDTYVVDGPMAPAIDAAVGQRLRVKGMLIHRNALGGEAVPTLVVGDLAVSGSDTQESPIVLDGCIRHDHSKVLLNGRAFTPVGPLAAALQALDGVCCEVTGQQSLTGAHGMTDAIFVTSIGRRDLTKGSGAVILPTDQILESVTADAVGRYTVRNPQTPAGTPDGTTARIQSAAFDAATRTYKVVVETFGGIAGISLGHGVAFVYDEHGKLLDSRAL